MATAPMLGCQTLLLGSIGGEDESQSDSSGQAETSTSTSTSATPTSSGDGMSPSESSAGTCAETGCEVCVPLDHLDCHNGDLYWFDSCGVVGDFLQKCRVTGCSKGACVPECVYAYTMDGHLCPDDFTVSDGAGLGGGESMTICGKTEIHNGYMQIQVKKWAGAPQPVFEDRRYEVRVSQIGDGDCGPGSGHFDVSDPAPAGVGTTQIAFNFPSSWVDGQVEKAYCVTAAMKPGEPDYDELESDQQVWWWSDKIVLKRELVCN